MAPTALLQRTSTVDISRYFQNPYSSYAATDKDGDEITIPPLWTTDECVAHAARLWEKCQAHYKDSTNKSTSHYGSLYEGALGAQVFVPWKFAAVHRQRGEEDAAQRCLLTASRNVEEALQLLDRTLPGSSSSCSSTKKGVTTTTKNGRPYRKRVTLLESPWVGAKVMQIAIRHDLDRTSENLVEQATQFCNELAQAVQEKLTEGENEVLYGRAGAIQAILFLRQCLGNHTIGRAAVHGMARHIIVEGQLCAARHAHDGLPLLWEWHHTKYLGAAHGVAGILHTLLSLEDTEELAVLEEEFGVHALIQSTLEGLQSFYCWSSGNLDSSIKASHKVDRLVHWCHGATGHILLLRKAYEVYGDATYKKSAVRLARNVVWQRGLLFKGVGLCHGISGNAYALLAAGQDNDDYVSAASSITERHAHAFARFALDNLPYIESIPDEPYSLYNGVAGLCTLFLDLAMSGRQARFPLYDHGC